MTKRLVCAAAAAGFCLFFAATSGWAETTVKLKANRRNIVRDSGIIYDKFLYSKPLPPGRHYIKKMSGRTVLRLNSGSYVLSLNSIFSVPGGCPKNGVNFHQYSEMGKFMKPPERLLSQIILRRGVPGGASVSNMNFPFPVTIPVSGCLVACLDGGPLSGSADYTMGMDIDFQLEPAPDGPSPYIINSGWEGWVQGREVYSYAQPMGSRYELVSLYGSYSNLGAKDTLTEFYHLPGGCGKFTPKVGIPRRTVQFSKLKKAAAYAQLPANAKLVASIKTRKMQDTVFLTPAAPVYIEPGDCLVSMVHSPSGAWNGDFENQIKYLLKPR